MAGVPLVIGEAPVEPLKKFEAALRGLHQSVLRHQSSFLLTLRLLLIHAVSIIDFVFEAMPPASIALHQRRCWFTGSSCLASASASRYV